MNDERNIATPAAVVDPIGSSDMVWYKDDMEKSVSDKFDEVDAAVAGKAASNHTHTGFASDSHTHTPASIGAATSDHTHTGFAADTHTHAQSDVTGLETALAGKASADHTHTVYSGTSASTYKLVYVSTTGSDDNAGTTAAPMATVKGAIRKYAEGYKYLDIRLQDGVYNEDLGAIGVDATNLSIRSVSENKDAVTINMATQLDLNSGHVRLYNMTLNVTQTGVRGISLNAGVLYAYGIRVNVPEASTTSCVNVYNGANAFLMQCVLNSGIASNSGAAIYGNQAQLIKAIGCTSERNVTVGVHAHNGSDIWYTDTINAKTKAKETYYGKCSVRA